MADDRKQQTDESRLNDVLAGDDELGRGSEASDERSDSLTAIPVDDRAMHDQARGSEAREELPEKAR